MTARVPQFEVTVLEVDGTPRTIRKLTHISHLRESAPMVIAADIVQNGVAVDDEPGVSTYYAPNRVVKVRVLR